MKQRIEEEKEQFRNTLMTKWGCKGFTQPLSNSNFRK